MSARAVALTGGVASGKSEVGRCFQALGVPLFDADLAAREALAPGSPGLAEAVAAFGPEILGPDGGLDRRAMRQRVFADAAARRRLEAIVHPHVRRRLHAQVETSAAPYAILAIPLLAESGGREAWPWLWRVLVVDVPAPVQRARLMARDAVDAALARQMLAAQASREQRLALADEVIANDGSLDALHRQVAALHEKYLALAAAEGTAG